MSKEIINIKVIDREGISHDLEIPTGVGLNIMECCKSYELPVEGVCGGMAMCASCHCYIITDHVPLEKKYDEQAMLDETNDVKENSRLGCQIPVTESLDGLVIKLAPEQVEESAEYDEW